MCWRSGAYPKSLKGWSQAADGQAVTGESVAADEAGAKKEFSPVRKGYDPAEVDEHLAEYDVAFRELEEYATRLQRELKEARLEIIRLQSSEQESIDKAMAAVFDSKDRIIDRAMAKALEIENQARATAGLPAITEPTGAMVAPQSAGPVAPPQKQSPPLLEPAQTSDSAQPDDVLQRMLEEAETIRERLDDGLAAAFDQMEQMQQAAEVRAADLLDEARSEATRLRAAASGPRATHGDETAIEVKLPGDEPGPTSRSRQSRYTRNSAGLPRIGDDSGPSVLSVMNGLRTKLSESEDDDQTVQDSSAS